MNTKKRIYIDLDGVIVDLIGQMKIELTTTAKQYQEETDLIDDSDTVFLNAQPIPHALEAVAKLEEHYNVFILSTAPWHNIHAWSQKRIWVDKYLPSMHKKLILTHHKDHLMGDYLIDDRLKNGAENFQGKHIHIFSHAFPTWESVLDELISTS